jgi:serine/threonine protein kinase
MSELDETFPSQMGKYLVRGLLGSGGMGSVYLAEDPDIGRQVAIKIVSVGADPDSRERFRREAQMLGRLNHPNIVTLLEYGEHQGQQYLVLEYLPGADLSTWMRTPRSLREQLVVAVDVARALAAAHAQGVLHRDIKPANVRVLPDGHAKLMDFGIARGQNVTLTGVGLVVGTPEYLAPEVILGEPASVQSDLHAFGTLLHNLLTGDSVFAGDSYPTTIARVIHVQPPALTQLLDGIPQALSTLVARCLSKTPVGRPQSAEEVVNALETTLQRVPAQQVLQRKPNQSTTRMPMAGQVAVLSGARRRTWLWALAAAITVGTAGVIFWPVRTPETTTADQPLVAPDATPSVSQTTTPTTSDTKASAPIEERTTSAEPLPPPVVVAEQKQPKPEPDRAVPPADKPAPPRSAPIERVEKPVVHTPTASIQEPQELAPTNNAPTAIAQVQADPVTPATVASAEPVVESAPPPMAPTILPTPEPEIAALSPRVVRRGQTVQIRITGQHLEQVRAAEVMLGTGTDARFTISRLKANSPTSLEFTITVSRSVPLGRYFLVLVTDAERSAPALLEVSL